MLADANRDLREMRLVAAVARCYYTAWTKSVRSPAEVDCLEEPRATKETVDICIVKSATFQEVLNKLLGSSCLV